jgi:hypothetical protein
MGVVVTPAAIELEEVIRQAIATKAGTRTGLATE